MLLELLYFSLLIVKERHFQNASEKQGFTHLFKSISARSSDSCLTSAARRWRPLRDLNPYYRRERAMS